MGKKMMILSGSPRKDGNTNTVVNWFAQAAEAGGAQVQIVDTSALEYKVNGCTECYGCQKSEKYQCVIQDQASPVIARIPQFDVVVFATPVFWCGPSAQLKLLLDRTFALMKFDLQTDPPTISTSFAETMCLISTGAGDIGEGLTLVDQTFEAAAGFLKCGYESLLVPFAPMNPEEMAEKTEVKQQAVALANKLIA